MLLTGDCPFDAESLQDLAMLHLTKEYAPPPAAGPREAYFLAVVERALRKDPRERFPSAGALASSLAVIGQPVAGYLHLSEDSARVGALDVDLELGDISACKVEVIVNAANWNLTMNVGVAAALKQAGGDAIEEEARRYAPVGMGDVVWTGAGRLRARWVAHAVSALAGSICLQRCTLRALLDAEARGARSIAFPALGTGVGDVPMDLAAKLMLEAIRTFASCEPRFLRDVRIVLFDGNAQARWREVLAAM
jgi:O-acetyl-ADP-ribose deacetylase (regulator of RNase III)